MLGPEVFREHARAGGHAITAGALTVDELARELGLTNNGVRAHLATLERDGIVRQRGTVRRGSGGGKRLLKAKVAVALQHELGRVPKEEEIESR